MKARAPTSTRAFVDAVDEGWARLVLGEDAFTVPVRLLPAGVGEGDWVEVTIGRSSPPPDDSESRRARLVKDDPGGDLKL